MEGYETAAEAAQRLGIHRSGVLKLCRQERLPGAIKVGGDRRGTWLIPKDSWPLRRWYGPKGKWEENLPRTDKWEFPEEP